MKTTLRPRNPRLNWGSPLTRGLVFCASAFEGGGVKCSELVTGSVGTLTNTASVTWTKAIEGPALLFNGAASGGGYVNFVMPTAGRALTLMSWMYIYKRNGAGGGNNGKVFHQGDLTTAGHNINENNTNQQLTIIYSVGAGVFNWLTQTVGRQCVTVITYDGSATTNVPRVWVDGIEQTVATALGPSGTLNTVFDTNIFIGNNSNAAQVGTRTINGSVSEVRKWNRILTPQEAKALYTNPWQIYRKAKADF